MGHMQLVHCLPLMTLHNIRILELVRCAKLIHSLDQINQVIASHQYRDDTYPKSLHQLREVRLKDTRDYYRGADLHVPCKFAALPSVKTLQASDFSWEIKEEGSLWPYNTQSSRVEELCFEARVVDASALTRLLAGIKALQTFSYRNNHNTEDGQPPEPRLCLNTLMFHSPKSLESVTFVIGSDVRNAQHEDATRTISLQECAVLKYVALNYAFFNVLKDTAGPREPECGAIVNGTSFAEDSRWRHISKVVDVLPPSLETLQLFHSEPALADDDDDNVVAYGNVVEDMFMGFARQKEARLPSLRRTEDGRMQRPWYYPRFPITLL